MSEARFEVVRTAYEQWHARYVAANGRIVWVTETYRRKVGAEKAIEAVVRVLSNTWVPTYYIDDRLVPKARPALPPLGGAS